MPAYALLIEYDGAPFRGWQRQAGIVSVQQALEEAALCLKRGKVSTTVAGRTDAGVHAAGQVVSLALEAAFPVQHLGAALNDHLRPHPVSVLSAAPAPPGWNPRFSALLRTYRYVILNRPAPPALSVGRVWHVPQWLDAEAMAIAAGHLLGRHDFSSFRAAGCQAKSALRTLDSLSVLRCEERIEITAVAKSFLYHQVRNFAGSLKLVGIGRWPPERIAAVLAAADRRLAGPTAPAAGLTLLSVRYPSDPFARPYGGANSDQGHDEAR
ncbi:MAG: tRNA pseudouridine(38-40) synthase TruA [Acetobacteraceae bacterium]